MDLDKIKREWNESGSCPMTDETTVKGIIRGKAKTALERLMSIETIGLYIMLPLIFVCFIIEYIMKNIYVFPVLLKTAYILFCIVGFFWQLYKCSLLKKTDIIHDNNVSCRHHFLKYRLCVKYEIIFGILAFIILYGFFIYGWKDILTENQFGIYCRFSIVVGVCLLLLTLYLYRRLYYKQIIKIEAALRDINNIGDEI